MVKIAVIGAGVSGLTVAQKLQPYAEVTIFEKSRGVGGRVATRYADPYRFDHGAQFFIAKSPAFQAFLQPLIQAGVVQQWHARFAEFSGSHMLRQSQWGEEKPHYVGVPGNNAIGKYLAQGLDIQCQTPVTRCLHDGKWQLFTDQEVHLGSFDWVVVTTPVSQAIPLIPDDLVASWQLADVRMQGCFSLLLGFDSDPQLPFDAALVRDADISWISVNSSKPGRGGDYTLLVHATNAWADAHLEDNKHEVQAYLSEQTRMVTGVQVAQAKYADVHAWRYANVGRQKRSIALDPQRQIAACGDWVIQGRVEAAFTSASTIAENMILCLSN
jgi:renalase